VANGALTLTGTVGPGETPATAYAVYGETVNVEGVEDVEGVEGVEGVEEVSTGTWD
jgi:hypothetical protein